MNIVISIDHNFVMPCGVLIHSICNNNIETNIRFFIVTDNSFTKDDERQLADTAKQINSCNTLECRYLDADKVRQQMHFKDGFYKVQVFYRLFLAELLPNDIEKVLFLDGDIVVRHSLKELWETDLSGVALGACQDAAEGRIEQFNRLGYSAQLGYFNAGVLLINLKYWRNHHLQQEFLDFVNENPEKIRLNDQDILNYICRERKIEVPLKYNVQSDYLFKPQYLYFDAWKHRDELIEARQAPVVLHYSGDRPWEAGCDHPYKSEFFKYQSQTMWKDAPLWPKRKSIKTRVIDALRPLGAKLGVCHVIPDYYDRSLKLK